MDKVDTFYLTRLMMSDLMQSKMHEMDVMCFEMTHKLDNSWTHLKQFNPIKVTTDEITVRNDMDMPSKKSFDRFGDHLSALIVKHLSFDQRFQYKCLSKQWLREISAAERELYIDKQLVTKWSKRAGDGRLDTDWQIFIKMLQKCSNIQVVSIERGHIDIVDFHKIMILLAKWVPNIKWLSIGSDRDYVWPNIRSITAFGQLRHLSIWCDAYEWSDQLPILAANCPHIISFKMYAYCVDAMWVPDVIDGLKHMQNLIRLQFLVRSDVWTGNNVISVLPLLDCRRLRQVKLDPYYYARFTGVDRLTEGVVRVSVTKRVCCHQYISDSDSDYSYGSD